MTPGTVGGCRRNTEIPNNWFSTGINQLELDADQHIPMVLNISPEWVRLADLRGTEKQAGERNSSRIGMRSVRQQVVALI